MLFRSVRPTHGVSILAVMVIIFWYRRHLFIPTALYGGAWLLAFVSFSMYHFGTLLPPYYDVMRLRSETLGVALLGNLISPTRGLFVFVPVTLFVAVALWFRWRHVRERPLVAVSALAVVVYFVVTSSYPKWWGGWSYGPRLLTGTLPWLVLLGIHSVESLPTAGALRRALVSLAAVTATASILVNALGAFAPATWRWNSLPGAYAQDFYRLWNWRDPQFLRVRDPE